MHCPALPIIPTTEVMLTIHPSFARRKRPVQWRIMLKAPFRLVFSTASKSSSFIIARRPSRVMPALFTRIWTVPNSLRIWAVTSFASP